MGVVAELLEAVDEAFRAVGAVDDLRLDEFDAGDEIVVVGVVGEGNGVVHAEAEAGSGVHRPAGDGDGGGAGNVPQSGGLLRHGGNDNGTLAGAFGVAVFSVVAEGAVVLFVDLAHLVNQRMLQDADAGGGQNLGHLLGLAQDIRVDHRRAAAVENVGDGADQRSDDFGSRRQAILRIAERAFHHEHVGCRWTRLFRGCRGAELEVAGVEQPLVAVVGQEHGRAEDVAGGERGQLHLVPLLRHAERHVPNGALAEAEMIKSGGRRRAEGQLMLGHVVGVGVGDEAPRLTAAKIDREIDAGQLQPAVVMEHGIEG